MNRPNSARKTTDILIIGGGVIGVCCAHFLTEAGARVTLIERDEIASVHRERDVLEGRPTVGAEPFLEPVDLKVICHLQDLSSQDLSSQGLSLQALSLQALSGPGVLPRGEERR